jgi:glutamyl-tRNA reductase
MQNYQVIGINHRTANAALLGQVSLNGQRREVFLKNIAGRTAFDGFVLSTCNRTEVYFCHAGGHDVLSAWQETLGSGELPAGKFYTREGAAMVEHVFRVACGLDSKIPGDNEIIGQLKEAFLFQKKNFTLGGFWERIVGKAVECSRKVRRETDFNKGSISTPYRIAKIIREETGGGEAILLVGAGEMIKLLLKYLRKVSPGRKLAIANRTPEKAEALAQEFGAACIPFGELTSQMQHFGTIISAIQVDKPVFDRSFFRKNDPKLLFDLGIPCNFAADVAAFHRYLDVNTIAEFNAAALEQRAIDLRKVEALVAGEVVKFHDWNQRQIFYRNQKSFKQIENHHRLPHQQFSEMAG